MSTIIYVARVQSEDQGYRATFPDLPGCEAVGRDLAELLVHARTAVIADLERIESQGDAWPPATPIERIVSEAGVMAIPIDVAVDDPPIRVNISLGERLVQRLDAAAEARGMTRSGFIAQSVRASLGDRARVGDDLGANAKRFQEELNTLGRRINDSIGPDSPFARRMNELDERVFDGVRKAADTVSAAMGRRLDERKGANQSNGQSGRDPGAGDAATPE
jgi:predicted RNase H-like HicB family nuclease